MTNINELKIELSNAINHNDTAEAKIAIENYAKHLSELLNNDTYIPRTYIETIRNNARIIFFKAIAQEKFETANLFCGEPLNIAPTFLQSDDTQDKSLYENRLAIFKMFTNNERNLVNVEKALAVAIRLEDMDILKFFLPILPTLIAFYHHCSLNRLFLFALHENKPHMVIPFFQKHIFRPYILYDLVTSWEKGEYPSTAYPYHQALRLLFDHLMGTDLAIDNAPIISNPHVIEPADIPHEARRLLEKIFKNIDVSEFSFIGISFEGYPITREMLKMAGIKGWDQAFFRLKDLSIFNNQRIYLGEDELNRQRNLLERYTDLTVMRGQFFDKVSGLPLLMPLSAFVRVCDEDMLAIRLKESRIDLTNAHETYEYRTAFLACLYRRETLPMAALLMNNPHVPRRLLRSFASDEGLAGSDRCCWWGNYLFILSNENKKRIDYILNHPRENITFEATLADFIEEPVAENVSSASSHTVSFSQQAQNFSTSILSAIAENNASHSFAPL